jgi:hypothetical protein
MATPAQVPLTFVAGDDEQVRVTITSDAAGVVPVDITGRTYTMSIAAYAGGTVLASDSGTVTGASGLVVFDFTDTVTAALPTTGCVYDVVEVSGSSESTLMLGQLSVLARVTA